MATAGVPTWSKTAASNSTADPAVNWAEGQAPSSVNDSARALMASVAKWRDDISGSLTTGGSSTAYTLTTNATFASLSAMNAQIITIIPHTTCGADPTLAVDGLTAKQIRTATGVNVSSGSLVAGTPYMLIYFSSAAEFILIGPLGAVGNLSVGGTLAVTGAATLSSTLALTGNLAIATNKFNVTASNGDTSIAGALTLTGALTGSSTLSGTNITASGSLTAATLAGSAIATQANMESGSATNLAVTPGRQHFHPGHPKAWASVASGGSLNAGYNLTSARSSTGVYVLTFSVSAMSSASYAVTAAPNVSSPTAISAHTLATGSFVVSTWNLSGVAADNPFSVAVFGDI